MYNDSGVLFFKMYFNVFAMTIRIGTPQQKFDAAFDFATVPLLITAEDCGIRRNDCHRMCNDDEISHLYCDPLCFPISDVMYNAYCQPHTLLTNSSTYNRLDGNWKERLQCCKDPLYGRFASERFQFGSPANPLPFKLEFVEGVLMQIQAFGDEDVIFGLGFEDSSGHVGVVEQLYQQKTIREPIIAFSHLMVVMGALDSQNCSSWSHFPVASDAFGWTFQVERVELFGVEFTNQQMTFNIQNTVLEVPSGVRHKLVELGIVLDHCSIPGSSWCVHNDTEKTFVVHGRDYDYRIEVPHHKYCVKHANQTYCHAETKNLQYHRSNGPNSWVIPFASSPYFQPFCYALNYAKRTVSIGVSLLL